MTNRTLVAIALIGAIPSVAGCGSRSTPPAPSSVTAPTPAPTPAPAPAPAPSNRLVTFTDVYSGFSTSDLHDAHEQVVRVTENYELIWVADGTQLPGYRVDGSGISVPGCACALVVRFGTREGERRAYLTADYIHDNPGTLVDLSISGSALTISRTTMFAPGTYTLSGVITEASQNGPLPVEGAGVWRLNEERSGWQSVNTDKNGFYELHGLYDGEREVALIKDGYVTGKSVVLVNGDTRFDREIVKR